MPAALPSDTTRALDPDDRIFSALLTRAHCSLEDGLYVKDLPQLGRPPERVVLVDDHVGACLLQPDNAVPVRPYVGEAHDAELPHVLAVLQRLRHVEDVRPHLRSMYSLQQTMLEQIRAHKAQRRGGG